jgi:hypothetical protein
MTPTPQNNGDDKSAKQMTAVEAAKRVKRPVVTREKVGKDKDGNDVYKDVTKPADVAASEVLSFKDYGDYVVVVTKDGKKFSSKAE